MGVRRVSGDGNVVWFELDGSETETASAGGEEAG